MVEVISAAAARAGAILLGRRTYRQFAGLWPSSSDVPMADYMINVPKHVVSTILDTPNGPPPDWSPATSPRRSQGSKASPQEHPDPGRPGWGGRCATSCSMSSSS